MMLRRGTGGYYVNGVVARWSRALISLRDQTTVDRESVDSLLLLRNLLLQRPDDVTVPIFQPQTGATVQGSVDLGAPNSLEDYQGTPESLFVLVPADPSDAIHFDWAPSVGSVARTGGLTSFSGDAQLQSHAAGFIVPTSYRGAVDPDGERWWEGWTIYEDS